MDGGSQNTCVRKIAGSVSVKRRDIPIITRLGSFTLNQPVVVRIQLDHGEILAVVTAVIVFTKS